MIDHHERKLSDFIDRLNAEQKPDEDEASTDSEELEELYQTVRLVRSLKEPAMPGPDFQKKLTQSITKKAAFKNHGKWTWITGIAGIAALLIFTFNFLLPFGRPDVVEAMEKAFSEVQAYHGTLEIVETNARGESVSQARLEVWANKEGSYYIKGLEGPNQNIVTVNNGQKKWQIRPEQKEVHLFPAFPDSYRFIFELGNEVNEVKKALTTKVVGEEKVAGRQAAIVEVTPKGGSAYRIWVDKETNLPLQKQTAMHNAIQYKITYTDIDFSNTIPKDLISYQLPNGFKEIADNPEQIVNDLNEVQTAVGYMPIALKTIPAGYSEERMAVIPTKKIVKIYYTTSDHRKRVVVIQGKASIEFKPAPTAILGKIDNNPAEIQSPVSEDAGVLDGSGLYVGAANVSSIRWQQNGYEVAVVGNVAIEELAAFTKGLTNGAFEMPSTDADQGMKPQVEVPYDLAVEENDQKNVDAGSSPWKLDPVFTAQVFVSLKISPEGISGDYPIDSKDLKTIENTGTTAIIEVSGDKTPIKRVYLKPLVRQDSTGIWTVVGYDPVK